MRWKHYTLVRIEPCEDKNYRTCNRVRIRGLKQQSLGYINNPTHCILTTPGEWDLFDIQTCPFQSNNIAVENPDIVKKMSDFYEQWWKKVEMYYQ